MSGAPFVNFYTSDFLGGTSGLTAATKGVYITLICLIYETEAPLSQNWDTLARRCGCTLASFRKAVRALEDDGKIEVKDGLIWSEKCERHIALRCERRSSAKAAAEKRWEKDKQKQGIVDAPAHDPQCKPEPEPKPEVKERTSKGARDVLAEVIGEETADAFIEMRKAIKKPLTLHAANLLCKRVKGHADPKSVFERSIENSWAGVFPENTGHKQRTDPTKHRTVPRPGGPMERPFKIVK